MTKYKDQEKKRQLECYYSRFFKEAKNNGHLNFYDDFGNFTKRIHLKYILCPEDSLFNLYPKIRWSALQYFKCNNIAWWREDEDRYFPTGHLVSSQIHCLNHLFAFREDKDALLAIINHATKMEFDEVLSSLIDDDGYLSFEFAYKNDDLIGENDKGARRGYMWTSIDAMIIARKGNDKWLIPIEWKYTETYEKEDKTCQRRLDRYEELIKKSDRLIMPENGQIPHSIYFQEPSYELMRQTLLCEQLKHKGLANYFFHLNVIPEENTGLRKAVEKEYIHMLKDSSKFKIVDPKELLSPIEEQNLYPELIDYLKTRYWQ